MPTLDTLKGEDDDVILTPQHVVLYSPPKAGKTQLIGELARKGFQLIWFDLENGKSTLLKLPREVLANILYIGVADVKDEPVAHSTIDKIVRGGNFNICDIHGRVDCPICKKEGAPFTAVSIPTKFTPESANIIVVADSATQLSISITNTILKGKPIDYQETLHDFRNQGNYLNRIFSYVQMAPFHFITTAHEIEAEREDGGMRIVPSIGSRNYAINCAKFFDHVVYMDKVNNRHRAYSSTQYSNSVLTGSRLDIAVEKMPVPDLEAIFRGKIDRSASNGDGNSTASSTPLQNTQQQAKAVLGGLKLK
jgi:hypothetical protein